MQTDTWSALPQLYTCCWLSAYLYVRKVVTNNSLFREYLVIYVNGTPVYFSYYVDRY